jgi:iron complex outermembrane receptor protein
MAPRLPASFARPLPFAVLALALAATLAAGGARAQPSSAAAVLSAEHRLALPAQPLGQTLNALAREWNVAISVDAALAAGLTAPALQGAQTLRQALDRALAGTGLSAIATGGAIVVQRAGQATGSMPPIIVEAQRESATGPVAGYAARLSQTATKTDTPLVEVPQSISVVGREEMEARGAQDVMAAIAYTPGVSVSVYGPDNRGWEDITLRGFNTYNSTYRDGLAQTPFNVTYPLTEPYALERVEVLRGPSSMAFGRGDAGGIIHRVSKQPTGGRIRELELQYGSFDRKQLAFDLGDAFGPNGTLSYRLVGVSLDSNDQDRYPDGKRINRTRSYIAPSLRWQPDARTSFTVFGEFLKDSSGEDPYFINANGRYTNLKMGDRSYSGIKQEQASAGYRLETLLGEDWTLRQNFRYGHLRLDRRVVWADSAAEDQRTIYRLARSWNDPMSQAGLDTQLQGKLRAGATEHTLLLGLDWNDQKGRARQFRGPAPDLDLYFPVYDQFIPVPDEPLNNYTQRIRQVGLYAQDQIRFGDGWTLTLGGRKDHVRSITEDWLESKVTEQRDSVFSGRAGITYLFRSGWAPYLSYTESFLPNAGLDAQNNPYRSSRGKQVEAGVKYQPADSRLLFTAAVYDLRKNNVVSYDPVTFEGRQIGKVRSRGIELEAKGELMPGLNFTASFTRLQNRVLQSADGDEIGKTLPLVPNQTAALWLDYTLGNGLGFGAGARYIGKRAGDEHNTNFERGVTVADATVHYERGPWRLALNVSNLFNRKYFSGCYHGECYRGNERAVTMTARYRWD